MSIGLSLTARAVAFSIFAAGLTAPARAQQKAEDSVTVEQLLKGSWQIAGFTNTFDNRSALILFRHPSETYLVQCRTGFDLTRKPPVYANCYEVR